MLSFTLKDCYEMVSDEHSISSRLNPLSRQLLFSLSVVNGCHRKTGEAFK